MYGEFQSLVGTMQELGEERGCGRALWEHQTGSDVSSYGTPMALMLLPYFTDGCIGSMEGLYFEASGTTPYHFLTAAAGSKQASNPVRRLAYDNNDVDLAVRYMQDLGIRYYLAFRPEVVAQADANPDLTALRQVGPWTVYEVAEQRPRRAADDQPGRGGGHGQRARSRFTWATARALAGAWARAGSSTPRTGPRCRPPTDPPMERIEAVPEGPETDSRTLARLVPVGTIDQSTLPPVEVSDLQIFGLDLVLRRPVGVPVLVKASYFPNWNVEGAEGVPGGAQLHGRRPDGEPGELTYGTVGGVPRLRPDPARPGAAGRAVAQGAGAVRPRGRPPPLHVAGRGAALARRAGPRGGEVAGVPEPPTGGPDFTDITGDHDVSRRWPTRSSGRRSTWASRSRRPSTPPAPASLAVHKARLVRRPLPARPALRCLPACGSIDRQGVRHPRRGTGSARCRHRPRLRCGLRPLRRGADSPGRPRHAALGGELVATFAEGATSRAPTSSTSGCVDRPRLLRLRAVRHAGRDVHCLAQPRPVQRHKAVPGGARPVGADTGLADIKAIAHGRARRRGARSGRLPRIARPPPATSWREFADHVVSFIDPAAVAPFPRRRRHRRRDRRPSGARRSSSACPRSSSRSCTESSTTRFPTTQPIPSSPPTSSTSRGVVV